VATIPDKTSTTTLASTQRVRWVSLEGKEVLLLDFSRAVPQESLRLIDEFREVMKGRAENSVLLLTDVTDAGYDSSISAQWKAMRHEVDHQIRASAIFGLSGLVGMGVRGFIEASRLMGWGYEKIRVCKDEAEAKQWLASK
jgi:hypothetical protein